MILQPELFLLMVNLFGEDAGGQVKTERQKRTLFFLEVEKRKQQKQQSF